MDVKNYLPIPIVALMDFVTEVGTDPTKRANAYKKAKPVLVDTALAVAGYFLASKYADKIGLNSLQVAALTVLVRPEIAKIAIGGHVVFFGVKGAIAEGRAHHVGACALKLAQVALGYFGTTKLISSTLQTYVYDQL